MASNQTNKTQHTVIITIDGPAGSGKSTVAKKLAKVLHYSYLDTGAMYRALTYKATQERVDLGGEDRLVALAQKITISLDELPNGVRVIVDGIDVSQPIRTVEVTNNVARVAQMARVREIMVQKQREIGESKNVVVEGRDVGTVVFPNAHHKFYIEADLAERARRRAAELEEKGNIVEMDELIHRMDERDNKDKNREVGPLKKAEDAIVLNSTQLNADEVVNQILLHINK